MLVSQKCNWLIMSLLTIVNCSNAFRPAMVQADNGLGLSHVVSLIVPCLSNFIPPSLLPQLDYTLLVSCLVVSAIL